MHLLNLETNIMEENMAYEVEVKAYVQNKNTIVNKLSELGCQWKHKKKQYDVIYHNFQQRDISSQKAIFFRIRMESGKQKFLTMKQILSKTEVVEFESSIGNPKEITKMIETIGFKEYVIVEKERLEGTFENFLICVDKVKKLGNFIEVEKLVQDVSEMEVAGQQIQRFLQLLEIEPEQICDERYHTMLYELENKQK